MEGGETDHFFSVSGEGAACITLLGCSAGLSANVGEDAWSESGKNEVGCETFRVASGAIEGREFELRADIGDRKLLEGGAAGRDHFFSVSGRGAAWIALLGSFAGVSANVDEEFAWLESGYNEVGLFSGCETF